MVGLEDEGLVMPLTDTFNTVLALKVVEVIEVTNITPVEGTLQPTVPIELGTAVAADAEHIPRGIVS